MLSADRIAEFAVEAILRPAELDGTEEEVLEALATIRDMLQFFPEDEARPRQTATVRAIQLGISYALQAFIRTKIRTGELPGAKRFEA